jgi:hypothetical protein
MSVAEILHQIEALPKEERLELVNKLDEIRETEGWDFPGPQMSEAERIDLEEKLKQRPNLPAELAASIKRMKEGYFWNWMN